MAEARAIARSATAEELHRWYQAACAVLTPEHVLIVEWQGRSVASVIFWTGHQIARVEDLRFVSGLSVRIRVQVLDAIADALRTRGFLGCQCLTTQHRFARVLEKRYNGVVLTRSTVVFVAFPPGAR